MKPLTQKQHDAVAAFAPKARGRVVSTLLQLKRFPSPLPLAKVRGTRTTKPHTVR